MFLKAEVLENGLLRVKSPTVKHGDEVFLETYKIEIHNADKGKWSEIEKVLAKADALDFPRRTHEEIIRDLHELRG